MFQSVRANLDWANELDIEYVLNVMSRPTELRLLQQEDESTHVIGDKETNLVEKAAHLAEYRLSRLGRKALAMASDNSDITYIEGDVTKLNRALETGRLKQALGFLDRLIDQLRSEQLALISAIERTTGRRRVSLTFFDDLQGFEATMRRAAELVNKAMAQIDVLARGAPVADEDIPIGLVRERVRELQRGIVGYARSLGTLAAKSLAIQSTSVDAPSFSKMALRIVTNAHPAAQIDFLLKAMGPVFVEGTVPVGTDFRGSIRAKTVKPPQLIQIEMADYVQPAEDLFVEWLIKFLGHGPVWLLRFMQSQRIQAFEDVTQDDLTRFLSWCAALPNQNNPSAEISSATLETRVSGLWWVYEQRHKMDRGLRVPPWDGVTAKEWASQAASTQAHGRTQEMPDAVAQALVIKALEVIKLAHAYKQAAAAYKKHKKQRKRRKFDWSRYGFSTHFEWSAFPSHVTVAGYVLIAMFSGMRVDEIVSLQLDYESENGKARLPCTFVEDVEIDGLVRRCYFVRGFTRKLEKEPRLTRWQVAPIVLDAIDAVIEVRENYRRGPVPYVFSTRSKSSAIPRMFENSMNDGLRKFVTRHGIRWNDGEWHLATHQFRKKFARMMVRQGLGIRDIQDQLKHIDIEMTKRYGHMDLYHELQMERFSLSNEQYGELLRGSTLIIGGGADLVESLRVEFIGKTRESQDSFLESLSKAALIDAVDFGLCMFNSQRAKCGGNRQNCKPADCLNSVIPLDTAFRHLEGRRVRNAELLRVVKSPLTRAHITAQQDTTMRLLGQAGAKGILTTADLKASAKTVNKGTP